MTTFLDIETTGLNPFSSQIVTAQIRYDAQSVVWKVWETGEDGVITGFLAHLDALPRSEAVVGYNILGFDLPFITTRLWVHRRMDDSRYFKLHSKKWFDLYHYLGADFRSVDYWITRLGVPRTCRYTGKDIPSLYEKKEYEQIEQHALEDLELCELLYQNLGSLRGGPT